MDSKWIIVGAVILSILIATIVTIIDYNIHKNDEYEEPKPQEKMYKAITTLAYLIIAIIIIAIIVKVLFWTGLISVIINH